MFSLPVIKSWQSHNIYNSYQEIRREGLETMTGQDLQIASNDRGMRSVGVSLERLRNQLDQVWRCEVYLQCTGN